MKPQKKKLSPKKRNPQDATLRNIRALKKRVDRVEFKLECLIHILAEANQPKRGKGK